MDKKDIHPADICILAKVTILVSRNGLAAANTIANKAAGIIFFNKSNKFILLTSTINIGNEKYGINCNNSYLLYEITHIINIIEIKILPLGSRALAKLSPIVLFLEKLGIFF
jgi:hypothetical protein